MMVALVVGWLVSEDQVVSQAVAGFSQCGSEGGLAEVVRLVCVCVCVCCKVVLCYVWQVALLVACYVCQLFWSVRAVLACAVPGYGGYGWFVTI